MCRKQGGEYFIEIELIDALIIWRGLWMWSQCLVCVNVFYKKCIEINNCVINKKSGKIANELKKEILKIATKYKKVEDKENFRPYKTFKKKKTN